MDRRLRIGFDAKRLFHNHTGLGNYSRTLVRNLKKYHPDIDIFLFTSSVSKSDSCKEFLDEDMYHIVMPSSKYNNILWRQYGIRRQIAEYHIDIYHGLSNELPFKKVEGTKYVATIHDLIFKAYPQQYKLLDRVIYDYKTKRLIETADHIIAISKATMFDIKQYYPSVLQTISVIYQSCQSTIRSTKSNKGKMILFVSSITERKNLMTLLKAMSRLKDVAGLKLNVVGRGGDYEAHCKAYVEKEGLRDSVTFLGHVDDGRLHEYYQDAVALVYPSIKEGFGIPIIEALSYGTHVITTGDSSMVEAGGHVAHYNDDAYDDQSLADLMLRVVDLPIMNKTQLAQHLEQFNGSTVTLHLKETYDKLLSKKHITNI